MPDVSVSALSDLDEATYRGVCLLLPQLSASATTPTLDELAQVASGPCTQLLVARMSGAVVGMLTLVLVRIPTKLAAHIEDVVVDASTRGLGIGRKLTTHALTLAAEAGARHVDLTSRPSRVEANRLYESLGFVRRNSNVLRYAISQ
jgi:ribosomal protein S18 acetylase RimI-like enzyme